MPIRLPRRWWEWALQFAPAAVILLAKSYDAAFVPSGGKMVAGLLGGKMIMGLDCAIVGVYFALPLCIVAAFFLTKPDLNFAVRAIWIVLLAAAVAAVNSAIAFGGCMLVMP